MKIIQRSMASKLSLVRYFDGNPCRNGHIAERYTSSGGCVLCAMERSKEHYAKPGGKEKDSRRRRDRYHSDPEYKKKKLEWNRSWSAKNKDRHIGMIMEWRENNKDKHRENINNWRRGRKRSDPDYIIQERLRAMIKRLGRESKEGPIEFRIESTVGYSSKDLQKHIESQFKEGMGWHNASEWEIDHIYPLSKMVSDGITDPAIVHALSNLQPLWRKENRKKANKVLS